MRRFSLPLAAAVVISLAAVAHAVLPAGGSKFKGQSSEEINGFKGPVKFGVSSDQNRLTGFKYGSYDCLTDIGFGPGNPFKGSLNKLGKVPLSDKGKFKKTKSITPLQGQTVKVTVKGKFTSKTKASGTITTTRKFPAASCKESDTFTAKDVSPTKRG